MAELPVEGGLWRPANVTEGRDFERKWCFHCVHYYGDEWEDEFGNNIEGGCTTLDAAEIYLPTPELTFMHGQPWCRDYREDPANPARCLLTEEMKL